MTLFRRALLQFKSATNPACSKWRSPVKASATPEPATITMLAIGIAGVAGYTWRRRKPAAP
jgi:hypothetical protein